MATVQMSFSHPTLDVHNRNILLFDSGMLHFISFTNLVLSRFQTIQIAPEESLKNYLHFIDQTIDSIVISAPQFTLFPSELNSMYSHDHLYAMCGLNPSGISFPCEIQLGNDICTLLSSHLTNYQTLGIPLFSNEQLWLKSLLPIKDKSICIDFRHNRFNLALFKNEKLQLFNSFNFASVSDFLYYLLGAANNCDIQYQELECKVSGMISPSSPLIEKMKLHFQDVSFLQPQNYTDQKSLPWIHHFQHLITL